MSRPCSSAAGPQEAALTEEASSGNGTSFLAFHIVFCPVMAEFPKPNLNVLRILHEMHTKFNLSLHSQASWEDASLDPCEWKKNVDSEAIVHQGSVILVCGALGIIFPEFLST